MLTLWVDHITAAFQEHGLKYPTFVANLAKCQVELNKEALALLPFRNQRFLHLWLLWPKGGERKVLLLPSGMGRSQKAYSSELCSTAEQRCLPATCTPRCGTEKMAHKPHTRPWDRKTDASCPMAYKCDAISEHFISTGGRPFLSRICQVRDPNTTWSANKASMMPGIVGCVLWTVG